jgi:tetratricopeptide (TPR) repeat protein
MEWYADYLFAIGKNNESLDLLKRSIDLDPFSTSSILHLGQFYLMNGHYDLAIEEIHRATELDPNFFQAYIYLGNAYVNKGMFDEAIVNINKAINLAGGSNYFTSLSYGLLYLKSGETEKALNVARELESIAEQNSAVTIWIAIIYAALDKKDQALWWIERSFEERNSNLFLLNIFTEFEHLKSDPEFIRLQRKIGLAEPFN